MEGKTLARIAAVVFVALAITATAIDMTRQEEEPPARPAPAAEPSTDPLRAEQRRCQRLGEQAASNAECMAVWAWVESRGAQARSPPRPHHPNRPAARQPGRSGRGTPKP